MIETIILALSTGMMGGVLGYIWGYRQKIKPFGELEKVYGNTIEELKGQLASARGKLKYYQQPPQAENELDFLQNMGIKLPRWASPIVNVLLEKYQNDPDFKSKADAMIKNIMEKAQKPTKNEQTIW